MGGVASVLYGAIASRLRHDPARRGVEMLPSSPAQDRGRSIAQKPMGFNYRHFKNGNAFVSLSGKCDAQADLIVWQLGRTLRMLWIGRLVKAKHSRLPVWAAVGVTLSAAAVAQSAQGVVAVTPVEMKWTSQGDLAAPGMEQLNLLGDPAKPGPYTLRLKFPKGFKIAPHTHPDSREVTILSGTFATGYGEKFDAANLKILPAGSFYTEPANVPHYIEIEEDTVLQVSGMGPSGRKFVNPPEAPK
jgi:quercetin dioxygenase-like cupin family protein